MLLYLTDRYPKCSAAALAVVFTVFPMILEIFLGGLINTPLIIFLFTLAVEFLMWQKVERMVLIFFPFIIMMFGFIAAEIIYTVSEASAAPGVGPDSLSFLTSSLLVTVFGAEAAGFIGALLLHALFVILKKIVELIRER